jgi:pimeloyl-ACP methyl ester carboxylesterase
MTSLGIDVAPLEFIDLAGYRMAYRQWGDTAASRAVVLVHGITSSSLSWVRVAPRLADRVRTIAVDLKGHGDSGRPEHGYQLADQANEVGALCTALGLEHIVLMGHSWGGGISVALAARNTLPIDRLVLEDPALYVDSAVDPERRARVVQGYLNSVGISAEEAEARARPNAALGWTDADIAGKVDASVKGSRAAVQAVFDENGSWNVAERLSELTMPTLMVRAEVENGGIVAPQTLELARQNPRIEIVTVPDADHNIHRGKFDAFMAIVEPFLAAA